MLTPQELADVGAIIETAYAEIESELIERIVRSIYAGKGTSGINSWRLTKLAALSNLDTELEAYISSEARKKLQKIEDAINRAVERAATADSIIFKKAMSAGSVGISLNLVGNTSKIFERYRELMITNCRKALNLTNTRALKISQKAFRDAVNLSWARVRTGAADLSTAVQDACHQLGGSGLLVAYRSDAGKVTYYPLDASIRRDIVTSLTQSTAEMTLAENNAVGNDLVIVSSHAACRPSHAPFQGKVYSYSGRSKRYPPLSDTGFGTPSGLCGCNCGHQLFPYYPEIEGDYENADKLTPAEKATNEKQYENSQKQRYLERRIRTAKRQLVADNACNAPTLQASQARFCKARADMREFIRATGRTRRYNREKI